MLSAAEMSQMAKSARRSEGLLHWLAFGAFALWAAHPAAATDQAAVPADASVVPAAPPSQIQSPTPPVAPNAGNAAPADPSERAGAIAAENNLASQFFKEGRYAEAIPHARRALALVEPVFGADDPFTAQFANQLAIMLRAAGSYDEARALFERVLATREKALRADDPLLAVSLNNLGAMYSTVGAAARAEPLLRRALAIREKVLAPLDPAIASTLTNLGAALDDLGRAVDAVPLYRRALAIDEQAYGADHPETATAVNNLAVAEDSLGHYAEALLLHQRALAVRAKTLGPEHPDTAVSLNNVSGLLERLGRSDEAIAMQRQALAINEKALGPDHPATAGSLANLASAYEASGRYDAALPLFERALAIKERAFGADSAEAEIGISRLALLQRERGEYDLALPLAQRALALSEKSFGPEHPSLAIALGNLADLNSAMGEYHAALELEQRALAIREKTLGPDHPETATGLSNLALLYTSLGDDERALPLLRRALAIRERAFGPLHRETALSLNNLAQAMARQHQTAEALLLQQRSLAIVEQALGPTHPDTAIPLNNLAALVEDMGRPREALPLYRRALAIRTAAFGPAQREVAASLDNLAALYETLGQAQRALRLYRRALRILQTSPEPITLAAVQARLGRYYNGGKLRGAAIFYLKLAVNTTQQLRAGALGIEQGLQQSLLNRFERSYRNLADFLIEDGRYSEALQIVTMMKEKEYFEFFHRDAKQDPRITRAGYTGAEVRLADRFKRLGERMSGIDKQMAELRRHAQPGAEKPEAVRKLEAESADAARKFDAWFDEVAKATKVKSGRGRQAEPIERDAAAGLGATRATLRKLGHDVALAHYIVLKDKVRILLIVPGRPTESEIVRDKKTGKIVSEEELSRKISSYRAALEDARKDRNLALAQELHDMLVGPIEEALRKARIKTLMLSLDGQLRYLPFGALYDGKQYLVERLSLPLYTDAEVNNLVMASSRPGWNVWALGLAKRWCAKGDSGCSDLDPDPLEFVQSELAGITCDQNKMAPGDAIGQPKAVAPLPGAMDCAKVEGTRFTKENGSVFNIGQAFLDNNFTEERIKEGVAKKYNVLHLATHFYLKDVDNSRLLLGNAKMLTLKRIRSEFRFDGVDLLTLSACKTGLGQGQGRSGQEVESLGVMVQKLGARATVATLWEVYDVSASLLIENFYRFHSQNNISKSEALRQAQLSLLHGRGDSSGFEHPAHWAPFVLMGNWL